MTKQPPKPEDMLELADSIDVTFADPSKANIMGMVKVAREYEREQIIRRAVALVNKMKGGMMTPWAVRKTDVIDLLNNLIED